MLKKTSMGVLILGMLALPQWAMSDGVATGIKVSTLGPGVDVEVKMNDIIGFRGNVNYLPFNVTISANDVDYEGDFSWKSAGAMIDVYPFSGIFRITGGIFYNGNDVDISASPNKNVTIGDHTYTPSQIGSINGSLAFNTLAPYLGLGWSGGGTRSGNLKVSFDLGVLFQGSASVDELYGSGGLAGTATFQADLDKEKVDIEDDMEPYKYYPVAALTVSYFW